MFKWYKLDSQGSVYLEMLIALSGWLILIGTIVPVLFHIQMERKILLIENEAQTILAEQVIKWSLNEPLDREKRGNYAPVYEIQLMPDKPAICVFYQEPRNRTGKICRQLSG